MGLKTAANEDELWWKQALVQLKTNNRSWLNARHTLSNIIQLNQNHTLHRNKLDGQFIHLYPVSLLLFSLVYQRSIPIPRCKIASKWVCIGSPTMNGKVFILNDDGACILGILSTIIYICVAPWHSDVEGLPWAGRNCYILKELDSYQTGATESLICRCNWKGGQRYNQIMTM